MKKMIRIRMQVVGLLICKLLKFWIWKTGGMIKSRNGGRGRPR